MSFKQWVLGMMLVGSLAVSGAVRAATDCTVCQTKRDRMQAQAASQDKTRELLGKNNAYLAVLSADQASKFLKVKSNLTVILKQLDQQKKEAVELEKDFQASGCLACASSPVPAQDS